MVRSHTGSFPKGNVTTQRLERRRLVLKLLAHLGARLLP